MEAVEPEAPPAIVVASEPSEVPRAVPNRALVGRLGVGTLVGAGFAPGANVGFAVFGGAALGRWSVDLEARFDAASSATFAAGTVQTSTRVVQVVPCVHKAAVFGCGVLAGGAMARQAANDADLVRRTS